METSELITTEARNETLVVSILQSIEIYHVNELRDAIRELLDDGTYKHLIIRMDDVPYLDSSGLGIFVQMEHEYLNRVSIRFCAMNPNVRMVFEYTNLLSRFQIDPDLKTSLEAIDRGDGQQD